MSRYLLDTDTISLLQHNDPNVVRNVASHPVADIAISAINVQEQAAGWLNSINRARKRPQIEAACDRLFRQLLPVWRRFDVLPYPDSAILRFEQLRSSGLNVGWPDFRIAAIALEYGSIVVTRNRRDFGRVPNLVIEDWSV